jgi:hypothetical protein
MNTTHTKTGLSLAEELERRGGCRYGLADVKVHVEGHAGVYAVWSTEWDKNSELRLVVYPADGPAPEEVIECKHPESCFVHAETGWAVHTADCWEPTKYPPGTLNDVHADHCTLASKWPVVCCRPRRSRGRKS